MLAAGDDVDIELRKLLFQKVGAVGGLGAILAAEDQQQRLGDFGEALPHRSLRLLHGRCLGLRTARDEGLEGRTDAARVAERELIGGDQLVMEEVRLEELPRVFDGGLLGGHAALEALLCRAFIVPGAVARAIERGQEAPRSEHDHMRVAGGLLERELHGGIAGLGMADEGRALEAERVHEFRDEIAAIGGRVVLGRIGEAEARLVEGDGAQTRARERRQVADEHVGRGAERGAVQEQHGVAGALLDVARVEAIDRDEFVLHAGDGVAAHGGLLLRRPCLGFLRRSRAGGQRLVRDHYGLWGESGRTHAGVRVPVRRGLAALGDFRFH